MLTEQEVVNEVYKYFITENHPKSLIDGLRFGSCAYRDGRGNKCAIGLFIPDGNYNKEIEGSTVDDLYISLGLDKILPPNMELLGSLQIWHDCWFGRIDKFRDICITYGLQTPDPL